MVGEEEAAKGGSGERETTRRNRVVDRRGSGASYRRGSPSRSPPFVSCLVCATREGGSTSLESSIRLRRSVRATFTSLCFADSSIPNGPAHFNL